MGCKVTVCVALVRPLLVTCTVAEPALILDGTRKLICVGLIKLTKAGVPFTVTPTPLSVVGRLLLVKSAVVQLRVMAESPLPLMLTQEYGATDPEKLAPLRMPVTWNEGAACMLPKRPCVSSGVWLPVPPIPAVK